MGICWTDAQRSKGQGRQTVVLSEKAGKATNHGVTEETGVTPREGAVRLGSGYSH